MHSHSEGIEKSLTETKSLLSKLHDEVTKTLEKIGTREKYLNGQLEHFLNEFRGVQVCYYPHHNINHCCRVTNNNSMM